MTSAIFAGKSDFMTTWLIANWKMNGDATRVRSYAFTLNQSLARVSPSLVCVFCPPATYLADAKSMLPLNAQLKLGAQDCHAAAKGAHTGAISAPMLRDVGAAYVILGHSERRSAGETDAEIRVKIEAALASGLTPIVCVGESRAVYEAKQTKAALNEQLAVLKGLETDSLLIAYEPVWAIGTGETPSGPEISAAHSHIKSVLGSRAPVLYGGSVNAGNLGEILALPSVAGVLIGGASLELEQMSAMVAIAAKK